MAKRGRRPKPWFREQTQMWYVTLGGEQIPLAKDEGAAYDEFYRVMAARGEGPAADGRITVRRLVELWLAACEHEQHSPRTLENYRLYSGSFVAMVGSLRARDLQKFHVRNWIAAQEEKHGKPWSQSTRSLATSIIKAITSWGDDEGHLEVDPLRKVKVSAIERRAPITLEEATGIVEAVRPEIQDALRILLTTGIRPGELCSMTAEKTHLERKRLVVTGKTGWRTVYLGAPAVEVLRSVIERHPKGVLLVNARGEPLTVGALEQCVRRARRVLSEKWFGEGRRMELEHVKPHCFRGRFATEALRAGVPMFQVSKLLGHKDPTILAKHYASEDDEMMMDAADLATRRYDSPSGTPPDPPD